MLTFERLEATSTAWAEDIKNYEANTVFQTPAWLSFVSDSQNAEPVVAALKQGGQTVGLFTGLMIKKWGLRILGSPFPGWTTSYMGLCLRSGIPRVLAVQSLRRFAFEELGCVHLEMMDRNLTFAELNLLGFEHRSFNGFQVDLTPTEAEIFGNMSKKSCQYSIRKAERDGVIIEEAHDGEFVEDYCSQLNDVFAKQSLVPTYSPDRVQKLIKHVHPTGMLLLLRARNSDGRCIATGIFPAMNRTMYFWGGASLRQYQSLHPNEPLHWHAMKYWKQRGIYSYDMGGGGEYKKKYGGCEIAVPWFRTSKYSWIPQFRELAKAVVDYRQKLLGKAQYCFRGNDHK
jgi:hypothetical protein